MGPDRVSSSGPLALESESQPIAPRGPARPRSKARVGKLVLYACRPWVICFDKDRYYLHFIVDIKHVQI